MTVTTGKLASIAAVGLIGAALGIGGTLGVQAVTDDGAPKSDWRSGVREGLAEEWGDAYAECIQDPLGFKGRTVHDESAVTLSSTEAETRRGCRREADEILP